MTRFDDRQPRDADGPVRLMDQGCETGYVLRSAQRQYQHDIEEPRAWYALQARRNARSRRRILLPAAAGLALTAAALVLLPRLRHTDSPTPAPTIATTAPQQPNTDDVTPTTPETPEQPLQRAEEAGPRPVSPRPTRPHVPPVRRTLPVGETVLGDGSAVRITAEARATLHGSSGGNTTIELLSGALELKVAPQHQRTFEVDAGGFLFRAMGTRFRVSMPRAGQPELEVSEGSVAVVEGTRVIARVMAGSRWSAPPETAPGALDRTALTAPDADRCLSMARQGHGREAISCLQPISAGTGLSAEMALYETARLQRDVLGDARAALETLQQHTTRFPRGALGAETRLSQIDLLARLGRTSEALAESGRLLAEPAGRERAADLHLLRGQLLRERLDDCARAEQEYVLAESDRGAAGAEAALGRGRCLEALGRRQEAAAAYRTCIQRGAGRSAAEARRRLEALQQ